MRPSHMKAMFRVALVLGGLAGTGWGQAVLIVPSATYPTIQSAINAAVPGDVVQVGPGTYVENLDLLGKEIQLVGAGPDLTTIDGNQSGAVIVCKSDEGPGTLIEGFTLTNGSGFVESGPLGATFVKGGGIYLSENVNSPFFATDVLVKNCRIVGNTAPDGGGGVHVTLFAPVTLEDCALENNSLNAVGQELSAAFDLVRCVIRGNTNPNGYVSGVFVDAGTSLGPISIRDCLIEGTQADEGALIYAPSGSRIVVEHCTFANNTATLPGAALILEGTSPTFAPVAPTFRNCVFWGNSSPLAGPIPNSMGPTLNLDHCLVQGGFSGAGNIAVDPKFVDPARGIYRLRPDSPAIDAGVVLSPPSPAIPIPLTLTFQGVVEATPGVFAVTNAVVVDVR